MTSWHVRRAQTAWRLGFALVLAGFLAVLFVAGQSLVPMESAGHALDALSQLSAPWLPAAAGMLSPRFRGMLVSSLLAFALMALGAAIAKRQLAVLDAARRETEDRQRRVRQYDGGERLEPFIGSAIPVPPDSGPR